ncbi:hypothetical protein ACO0LB_01365 [Undibacterium sp. SXout7W]|uniref:hypothetical protein n=1 Tax=Undibacterium sp. SXout7W TaxID=3413049 RepID=UPI003BF1BD37
MIDSPKDNFDELFDEKDSNFLNNSILSDQIQGLKDGIVSYGDGNLAEKAKYILELGIQPILRGETPSPIFLTFVADSIRKVLEGEEKTLDDAFGLKLPRGRQAKDPQLEDKEVEAYNSTMVNKRDFPIDERRKESLDAAFKARYQISIDELRERGFDEKSINDRQTELKRTLKKRGVL